MVIGAWNWYGNPRRKKHDFHPPQQTQIPMTKLDSQNLKRNLHPFPKIHLTQGTGAHWQEHFHLVTFEQNWTSVKECFLKRAAWRIEIVHETCGIYMWDIEIFMKCTPGYLQLYFKGRKLRSLSLSSAINSCPCCREVRIEIYKDNWRYPINGNHSVALTTNKNISPDSLCKEFPSHVGCGLHAGTGTRKDPR